MVGLFPAFSGLPYFLNISQYLHSQRFDTVYVGCGILSQPQASNCFFEFAGGMFLFYFLLQLV